MTYDDVRAANPDLVVNLYGMDPTGPVTLELILPTGEVFTFQAETAAAAIALAFPAPEPVPSVFD